MYILLFLVVLISSFLYHLINEWYIEPYEELKLNHQKEIKELNLQIDDNKKWYEQVVNYKDKVISNLEEQLSKTSKKPAKKSTKKVEKKEVKDKIVVKGKKEKKPTKKILEKFEIKNS